MVKQTDVMIAAQNWLDWQDVFEYTRYVADNPLLTRHGRFKKFLGEYRVHRTIRRGTSDQLRTQLGQSQFPLAAMLNDATGQELDIQQDKLRVRFGTCNGQRRLISPLSKIAAFLAPHAFTAWDQYARKGVNIALHRPPSRAFGSYADYLADVNLLMTGEFGRLVRAACPNNYPTQHAAEQGRFHRRVLDVCLMRLGGRQFRDPEATGVVSSS